MAGIHRRVTTLPNLAQMMIDKGTTYENLANAAGLNKSTVWRAKQGKTILVGTAELLLETLTTRFRRE